MRGTLAGCLALLAFLTGCGVHSGVAAPPVVGACRVLSTHDLGVGSNSSSTVPCSQAHTAQTFAVGPIPDNLTRTSYDDPVWAAFGYERCYDGYKQFLGADDSLALRSVVSWAFFRPSPQQWKDGARWFRCDAVGGTQTSAQLVDLPTKTQGLLLGVPSDKWMLCANGPTVDGAPRVPCSQPHNWRAVTTIKLGEAQTTYPGDTEVQKQTDQYCRDSVGAWLKYPVTYSYGTTWFGAQEWAGGNRRSVCWAETK